MESLTVIIPNYNKEQYLEQCVKSVVHQTFHPNEIIIVDDCSTDDSKECILSLSEKYKIIKPVFLEKNGGVSNARNVGLKKAKGKYVTFLDSDDFYYNKSKLENEMKILLHSKGNAMVYSRTILVDDSGKRISCKVNNRLSKKEFIQKNELRTLLSLQKQKRIPRDYCIEKAVLMSAGAYSYPYDFYEDLDLLMRLAVEKVKFIPCFEDGTAYRQTHKGLSIQSNKNHVRAIAHICKEYLPILKGKDKTYATVGMYLFFLKITILSMM